MLRSLCFLVPAGCFFLPFVRRRLWVGVGDLVAGWSGADLTVGGWVHATHQPVTGEPDRLTTEQYQVFLLSASDEKPPESILFLPSQPLAIVAAVLVLAGLLAMFLAGSRWQAAAAAVAGLGAAVALSVAEWLALQKLPLRIFDPGYGFWLTIAFLLALGVWNAAVAIPLWREHAGLTSQALADHPPIGDDPPVARAEAA